mmetsp:Transcript_31627/g.66315  ORF Transcript_31627/g.66315 Transcript_31627/m.66315 type:complete len:110 (+) Transcript_31627:205-534(+)
MQLSSPPWYLCVCVCVCVRALFSLYVYICIYNDRWIDPSTTPVFTWQRESSGLPRKVLAKPVSARALAPFVIAIAIARVIVRETKTNQPQIVPPNNNPPICLVKRTRRN